MPTIIDIPSTKQTVVTSYTLLASSWSNGTYTYTNDLITADSEQEWLPGLGITTALLEVLQTANIQDYSQSAGTVVLKAYGEVPTVDIPIRIVFRG